MIYRNSHRVTRRSFVRGISAGLIIPPSLVVSRGARSTTAGVWATHFDGSSYLINTSTIPNMPAPSKVGFLSVNYRSAGSNGGGGIISLGPNAVIGTCTAPSRAVAVAVMAGNFLFQQWGPLPASCNGQNVVFGQASGFPNDGNWHSMQVGWDGSTPKVKARVDGVAKTISLTNYNGLDLATDYAAGPSSVGGIYNGDLADVYLAAGGGFIDPDNVWNLFWDSETGYATRNGSSGSGIIPGATPQIFLTGGQALFWQNLAKQTAQYLGTQTADANAKFAVNGTLTTAATDPFDPNDF